MAQRCAQAGKHYTPPHFLLSLSGGELTGKYAAHPLGGGGGAYNSPRVACSIVSIISWAADGGRSEHVAFVSANCWPQGRVPPRLAALRFASTVPGGGCL